MSEISTEPLEKGVSAGCNLFWFKHEFFFLKEKKCLFLCIKEVDFYMKIFF